MSFNEKILTPDVVNIDDVKILSSKNESAINTSTLEKYDDVLTKVSLQVLDSDQKDALSSLSSPSATNPIVLKNDLQIYYPIKDLGEIRDSVASIANLPLSVTPTGNLDGTTQVINVSDMSSVVVGQYVLGTNIPANAYIVSVGTNSFEMNIAALTSEVGATLTIRPGTGDLRPVLDINSIYRWDGTSWELYLDTGTLDHTQLINQNADVSFQHITSAEKATLLGQNHTHGFTFLPSDVQTGFLAKDINKNETMLDDGVPIQLLTTGVLPSPLSTGITYYTVNTTPISIQLSTSLGGPSIVLLSQGTGSHSVFELPLLESITDAGSGKIITVDERKQIPSTDEKGALVGTVGTPSGINKYVTNQDVRLNTIKNPYVTVGTDPTCSYVGSDVAAFQNAFAGVTYMPTKLVVDSPGILKAPNTYEDGDLFFFKSAGLLPTGFSLNIPYIVKSPTLTDFRLALPSSPFDLLDIEDVGSQFDFVAADIDTVANTIHIPSHGLIDGIEVGFITTGTVPEGLYKNARYYIKYIDNNYISLSVAVGGDAIALTSQGSGTHTITSNFVVGNNGYLKAIEVFPGNYTMYAGHVFENLVWQQDEGLLLECRSGGANLTWECLTDALSILSGRAKVTVRGFTFTLKGANTRGISLSRNNCVIENCNFVGITPLGHNHKGITVNADNITIKKCNFSGYLFASIDVFGQSCRIQECSLNAPVAVKSTAVDTQIYNNVLNTAVSISSGAKNTSLIFNQIKSGFILSDNGTDTTYRENKVNVPAYINKKKTIGASYAADYQGNTSATFSAALSDPYVKELYVLPGTYNIASTINVPAGVTIYGASLSDTTSAVNFTQTSNQPIFTLNKKSKIENINLSFNQAIATSVVGEQAYIKNCKFNSQGYYASSITSDEVIIEDNDFIGTYGLNLSNVENLTIKNNRFQCNTDSLVTVGSNRLLIKNNFFIAGVTSLTGEKHIIEGNHFLAGSPDKSLSTDSIWQGNYPHPEANNYGGIDVLNIPVMNFLCPLTPGVSKTQILGLGVLSYLKTADAKAGMSLLPLAGHLLPTGTFDLKLHWTSNSGSGNVVWQIDVTFKNYNSGIIGTTQSQIVIAPRTQLDIREEEVVTVNFANASNYGGVVPTHVAVSIKRLPAHVSDTLPTEAFLVNANIRLKRY